MAEKEVKQEPSFVKFVPTIPKMNPLPEDKNGADRKIVEGQIAGKFFGPQFSFTEWEQESEAEIESRLTFLYRKLKFRSFVLFLILTLDARMGKHFFTN